MEKHHGKNGRIYVGEKMERVFEFISFGNIKGVYKLNGFCAEDNRGMMKKLYSEKKFLDNEINFTPMEVMNIYSNKNVLRGLHYQRKKMQSKLISCIMGRIWGVIVDLRKNSETFGKWISFEISGKDELTTEILIPSGCGLGTLAIEESLISCICGENYYRDYDDGILWNDKDIGIEWPLERLDGTVIISDKDNNFKSFKDFKAL